MWHTGDERVKEFGARVRFYNPLADLAMIEATTRQPSCSVPEYGWTRTSTVSTGVTTSQPYRSTEGERHRVLVSLRCVGSPGMSGCPVGLVLGMMASGIVDTITKRLVATLAIYTSEVVDVMKRWLQLPDNDPITIDQVIGML
ncbi:hypothetical protein PVAP13_2NG530321 [Panicum virgatum]|uniref:Uncharacterized protein n=1 Tax=Panicum virgatum TaxID=38727 RepID=A0A8T0VQX7_PANVG|nr:hypothetical protein PVAP13_2NG530321 [Panicum virgatum]